VTAADGPERLYGEWWRRAEERAAIRDYFQVEDESGARFWLFRKGDGEDPVTGDLSWHMHGLFA
jgi:protein ImuB